MKLSGRAVVESIALFRYRKRFSIDPVSYDSPARVGSDRVRSGLLLRIGTGSIEAWGESAPLPGYSHETLSEAESALTEALSSLHGALIPTGMEMLATQSEKWDQYPASVRFGLEQSLASLGARIADQSLESWLSPDFQNTVAINALIFREGSALQLDVEKRLREGYRDFKLKVGRLTLEEDIARVRTVRSEIGPACTLRLDANRAWSFEDAVHFAGSVSSLDIDYIEEPLLEPSRMMDLYSETRVNLAVDEILGAWMAGGLEEVSDRFAQHRFLKAAVFKPMRTGGWVETLSAAGFAEREGILTTITSLFETGVGLAGLRALAAALPGAGSAAGLDTLRQFYAADESVGSPTRSADDSTFRPLYPAGGTVVRDTNIFDNPFFAGDTLVRLL